MLKFEKNKPNILALDDQNERIAKLRQKENMENEAFIKLIQKELKVSEKQEKEKTQMMSSILEKHRTANNGPMPKKEHSDELSRIKEMINQTLLTLFE